MGGPNKSVHTHEHLLGRTEILEIFPAKAGCQTRYFSERTDQVAVQP